MSRTDPALREALIRRGRAGDPWALIGAELFGATRNPSGVASGYWAIWANDDDKRVRHEAVAGRLADTRVAAEPRGREGRDLFAGMGKCFA